MNTRALFLPLFLALALNACSDDPVRPPVQIEGQWGGEHISLTADASGAGLDYDCAHGTIDEPLAVDGKGNIDLIGTHTRESGGPVHEGDPPDIHPARYRGLVTGTTMILTRRVSS